MQVRVNGPDTAPVYKFLKANKSGFLGSRIKWNFTKFLVDKEGNVLRRYGSTTSPFSIEVQSLSISLHGAYVRLCSFHLDFDVSALNNAKSCHLRLRFQDTNGARQSHIALQGYATISCVNVCGYCYVTRGLVCKCEKCWYVLQLKLEIISYVVPCRLYRMTSREHWGRLEKLYNHFKLVLLLKMIET